MATQPSGANLTSAGFLRAEHFNCGRAVAQAISRLVAAVCWKERNALGERRRRSLDPDHVAAMQPWPLGGNPSGQPLHMAGPIKRLVTQPVTD